jgi:hypothetical protein
MLTSLGIGEAAVTVLSDRGTPTPVAWTMLRAPRSLMAPIEPAAMAQAVQASPLQPKYGQPVDRDSAYERLAARLAPPPAVLPERRGPGYAGDGPGVPGQHEWEESGRPVQAPPEDSTLERVLGSAAFRSFTRSAASALGRELTRGLFGTRRRRRSR